eukprot:TRINITY_DN7268_c0_g2_i1.p1 TRINITY_DN7268_c0_g2~~TRINITY_DN7268_c0_g2_i1.p1  ORF type:complete len:578 (+),score=150.98 TRINITY_DN7268_c0_g2_i1:64-1797(+)
MTEERRSTCDDVTLILEKMNFKEVRRHTLIDLLIRIGVPRADAEQAAPHNDDKINMVEFVKAIFADSSLQTSKKDMQDGVSCSCWNVRSPDLSGNLFEMYQGKGVVVDPVQVRLLTVLATKAEELLLGQDSMVLGELLPDDHPLQVLQDPSKAGNLEAAPLQSKHKDSLKGFFKARLGDKSSEELDGFIDSWLASPKARWEYWKKQRARDFIADDGSGGKAKANSAFPKAASPLVDDEAWELALGMADQKYGYRGLRVKRISWLYPEAAVGEDAKLEPGKHDMFKLLVWDELLRAVHDRARKEWPEGEAHWDKSFAETKTIMSEFAGEPKSRMKMILKIMVEKGCSDIVVLCEVPAEFLCGTQSIEDLIREAGGPTYEVLKPETPDVASNTIILVRQDRFKSWTHQHLHDPADKRTLRANLVTQAGTQLQVFGLHLPGNGHNIPQVFDSIEEQLANGIPAILAGDLNLDLRVEKSRKKVQGERVLVRKLLEASKHLWNQEPKFASVNKQRTPFQAQVSKINFPDFAMKDAILVSETALGKISGLIGEQDMLPSQELPSDHALIRWQGGAWPKPLAKE